MTLEVKGSSSSRILICANGTFLNFTPREFAIITGLNCVSNRYDFIFDEGVPNRIVEKYFNGAEIIQKRQLFLAFTKRVWGENNDADAEKFTILYFLHSFVLSNVETVVVFKNIEPTKKELSKLQILQKDATHHERFVDSDDDFQDPPPRKSNEHSKKKQKEQVEDIEADKAANVDEGGLEQSGQHFSPDIVQSPDNISDGTKGCTVLYSELMNVEIDSQQLILDELLQSINLDYLYSEKVVQHDCQTSDKKIDETILSDSQFTIPDEMLPSLNVYQIQNIIIHPSANRLLLKIMIKYINRGITDSEVEIDTEEQVRTPPNTQEVTNDEQRDENLWPDSQNKIPDEFLPILNIYNQKSIIIHPFANREHIDVCFYYLRKKSKYGPHSSYKNEPNKSYKYSTVDCNFMDVIRSLNDVYSMDAQNLKDGGREHHLMEYINGFRMHAAVPWHTVEDIFIPINIKEKHHWILAILSFSERCIFLYDSYESNGHYAAVLAEIEKIAKIIPLCLQACDFYVKKGIDHQSHPRYKDKESSDMFDVLFQDDLPQQLSGSLDCGVFMVMYVECLSYGHKVIASEFDPNTLRTRYAALLWDMGSENKKQMSLVMSKHP
ncbi:hypothetical protein CQW23_24416 [Capsicum baccatum]|uniref:Ubiquitin-like protease family profile domain-containing protein n=1 Tax=Capsicum baccatum TaxID=33114 RepID=A0A2G2VUS0_CAPBA|nr:hypothetical protein CQW23_24416 [Capsicum baccatum]